MRCRIEFVKTDHMRYTGHLDLHRAWERLVRRAGLPLAYTQGFSPHPRINLASALPLGFTSTVELVDIWLDDVLDPHAVQLALQAAAPPGIELHRLWVVEDRLPALQTVVQASRFHITLLEPPSDLAHRVSALLDAPQIDRVRRGKPYDLRPLVLELQVIPPDVETPNQLNALLAAREGATGRPEEVLEAMGIDPLSARVQRVELLLEPGVAEA